MQWNVGWIVSTSLALALLDTGGRTPIRARFEQLRTANDLTGWLSAAIDAPVRATAADLVAMTDLREAVFESIRARTWGTAIPRATIQTINTAASATPLAVGLDPTGRRRERQQGSTAAGALSTTARDAIELLTGPMADRVRECANADCEIVFVDTSPPGARRWCAMGRCGNRLKNRDYRHRRAATAASSRNALSRLASDVPGKAT
jgi:predicted RNA-binding Zn ribbon-like protein